MSTGIIIAIVAIVAVIVIGLLFVSPRMRVRRRERELQQRRQRVVGHHRQEASVREERAEAAERRARMAEYEAQRERADAQLHQTRAETLEQGVADHELVEDGERKRFAGTSAAPERGTSIEQDADAEPGGGRSSVSGDRADYSAQVIQEERT
jgi:FtsZ-interacting cell division protein ZipA